MARTKWEARIESPIGSHSVPQTPPTPYKTKRPYAKIDTVTAWELDNDNDELLLVPFEYTARRAEYDDDYWRDTNDCQRCWKISLLYQRVAEHPRLVSFVRMDGWTGFPVLAKPTGLPLETFIRSHHDELYEPGTACQLKAAYLPLAYHWILQHASALKHVHSYNPSPLKLVCGGPRASTCWLTAALDLTLVGFLDAGFQPDPPSNRHPGQIPADHAFCPEEPYPTIQTDIFLFGCFIYQVMTSVWPGESQLLSWDQQAQLVRDQLWPTLASEHLGAIARRCWTSQFTNADLLLSELQKTIAGLGQPIRGDDELAGIDTFLGLLTMKPQEHGHPPSLQS